jgi:hypothetical protein
MPFQLERHFGKSLVCFEALPRTEHSVPIKMDNHDNKNEIMTRPVATIETCPLTGEDAGPMPIASPKSVEDLTTMIDPDGCPKKFDPSTSRQSPIHEQLGKRKNGEQRGWLEACLSTETKPIFIELARATSSGFREGNLAESLFFGWNVNESKMENVLSRADFPAFPMPASKCTCAKTQAQFMQLANQSLNWKHDPN